MLRQWLSALRNLFSGLGPNDFVVIYRPNRPMIVRGKVARIKVPGIAAFFTEDLKLADHVTIRGSRNRGLVRVRISPQLKSSDCQKIRNFLLDHLR